ncbi:MULTISPECIES: PBP1A family penicillin-binding protein [unclassified Sphingopyxis]|uniref:penicillin-binding protein 1A n=1 Tax=unclassified Sphingopyxis TaxID=2614943 RepID=UPI0007309CCE|nr:MULTISPECIES: PBP1A family penicillin-binding protein [unclassified Sphingopyxis]KTE23556.1 penicillin-binding protein [Sphingopyxis sp. H057]KTE49980.1 penicillin-binding protein [Sphingopyxis sp. H073]KTE53149.1 penicillin-binding protein [Sphingopyxis sp. H071]KTE59453.1 penicillin-binding protein [Sphingopyxis sp. H107]KTE63528.1 penicillin-binding protein [Sphingopyxis sp. H100]
MASETASHFRLRLRRDSNAVIAWFREMWTRRWFRILGYLAGAGLLAMLLIWVAFARNLPSVDQLRDYQPPLPTMVRDAEGKPVHSYARERRVQLEYAEYPQLLVRAYLAAEDRTFFEHGGIDYPGIVTAIITNLTNSGRPVGASTITQQVAKNLLLTNEVSYTRKIREAILAKRIEAALTKEQILELYLNEIPLGRRSFGVQAAARAYFDKDVDQLALHEMAFLAILPKAPETYGRARNADKAMARRNFVLSEMYRNGWITAAQRDAAQAQPLGLTNSGNTAIAQVGGYYMEEVRRQLIDQFGETPEDGPLSVYGGGLWVRTAYDGKMQQATTKALRRGLIRYDTGKGWSGPIATIEADDQWQSRLASSFIGIDYDQWRIAAVLSKSASAARIGFANGDTGSLPASAAQLGYRKSGGPAFSALRPGDLIAVRATAPGVYQLKNIPEVSGGMVVESPHSGRIYAMQGGFDVRLSPFNRATQAERQPGSTIKPFVYAAALDNGMTPATMIVDGPFCVYQGARFGNKCFRNFGGSAGSGEHTMRWGLEQSRNLMTVRTASQIGMEPVVETIQTMGIGKHEPYLSTALGAGSTTVEKITNAYAMLANHGRELKPRLIDYAQDRRGKVIFPKNWRPCQGCNMKDWDGKPMPRFAKTGKQLMDPMTAYQVVHMLEGVVQRGTAVRLRDLGVPLFGKTGTTSGPKDVWFVGGSPDVIAGVYIGFDQPRNMGGYAQGGSLAAPIFKEFFQGSLMDAPPVPFTAPKGIRMVRIDRQSGRRVYGSWPGTDPKAAIIWEAFKPESEPRRTIREDEIKPIKTPKRSNGPAQKGSSGRTDTDFLDDRGGII